MPFNPLSPKNIWNFYFNKNKYTQDVATSKLISDYLNWRKLEGSEHIRKEIAPGRLDPIALSTGVVGSITNHPADINHDGSVDLAEAKRFRQFARDLIEQSKRVKPLSGSDIENPEFIQKNLSYGYLDALIPGKESESPFNFKDGMVLPWHPTAKLNKDQFYSLPYEIQRQIAAQPVDTKLPALENSAFSSIWDSKPASISRELAEKGAIAAKNLTKASRGIGKTEQALNSPLFRYGDNKVVNAFKGGANVLDSITTEPFRKLVPAAKRLEYGTALANNLFLPEGARHNLGQTSNKALTDTAIGTMVTTPMLLGASVPASVGKITTNNILKIPVTLAKNVMRNKAKSTLATTPFVAGAAMGAASTPTQTKIEAPKETTQINEPNIPDTNVLWKNPYLQYGASAGAGGLLGYLLSNKKRKLLGTALGAGAGIGLNYLFNKSYGK